MATVTTSKDDYTIAFDSIQPTERYAADKNKALHITGELKQAPITSREAQGGDKDNQALFSQGDGKFKEGTSWEERYHNRMLDLGSHMCIDMRRYIGMTKQPTVKISDQVSFASATDASSQDATPVSMSL